MALHVALPFVMSQRAQIPQCVARLGIMSMYTCGYIHRHRRLIHCWSSWLMTVVTLKQLHQSFGQQGSWSLEAWKQRRLLHCLVLDSVLGNIRSEVETSASVELPARTSPLLPRKLGSFSSRGQRGRSGTTLVPVRRDASALGTPPVGGVGSGKIDPLLCF